MVKLIVQKLPPHEQNEGFVRIDPKVIEENDMDNKPVSITSKNSDSEVATTVLEGFNQDYNKGIIRIDKAMRKSLNVSLGERVNVSKITDIKTADSIELEPARGRMTISNSQSIENNIKTKLTEKDSIFKVGSILEYYAFIRNKISFKITSITPEGSEYYKIDKDTDINIQATEESPSIFDFNGQPEPTQKDESKWIQDSLDEDITYEDIGGLDEELEQVREMVEYPMRYPQIFENLGIDPPTGLLLHGSPGTGKTLIAKAVANEVDAKFLEVSGPELLSKYYGESEGNVREIFEEARENSPAIIFFDEIDAIASSRSEASGDLEKRVVAQLLSLMDGMKANENIMVIGATNRVNEIDSALRRGGRFDREIEIGVPSKADRKEILQIHTRGMPLSEDVDLDEIASQTHGYVGSDLATLVKEAAMNVFQTIKHKIDLEEDYDEDAAEIIENVEVGIQDFKVAMKEVDPSAMRELVVEIPDITYDDVGGLEDVKSELKESIEWPISNPEIFEEAGIRPSKGTLLYGPPGTGKTLIAKAVANESNTNFIPVKGPEILDKFVGESEKGIRDIFNKARQNSPSIIFFDEIDAIASERGSGGDSGNNVEERVVSQILTELDGIEELSEIKVIATTNRPNLLDSALLRPGRFDNLIQVSLPSKEAREEIFKIHTKDSKLSEDVDIKSLAMKTEGYSGSDIEHICREAIMKSVRRVMKGEADEINTSMKDFNEVIRDTSPSVSESDKKMYKEIEQNMNQDPSETRTNIYQ